MKIHCNKKFKVAHPPTLAPPRVIQRNKNQSTLLNVTNAYHQGSQGTIYPPTATKTHTHHWGWGSMKRDPLCPPSAPVHIILQRPRDRSTPQLAQKHAFQKPDNKPTPPIAATATAYTNHLEVWGLAQRTQPHWHPHIPLRQLMTSPPSPPPLLLVLKEHPIWSPHAQQSLTMAAINKSSLRHLGTPTLLTRVTIQKIIKDYMTVSM